MCIRQLILGDSGASVLMAVATVHRFTPEVGGRSNSYILHDKSHEMDMAAGSVLEHAIARCSNFMQLPLKKRSWISRLFHYKSHMKGI